MGEMMITPEPKDKIYSKEELKTAYDNALVFLSEAIGTTLTGAHNSEDMTGAAWNAYRTVVKNVEGGGLTGEQIVRRLIVYGAEETARIDENAQYCSDLLKDGENSILQNQANAVYHKLNLSLAVNAFADQLGLKAYLLASLGNNKKGAGIAGNNMDPRLRGD